MRTRSFRSSIRQDHRQGHANLLIVMSIDIEMTIFRPVNFRQDAATPDTNVVSICAFNGFPGKANASAGGTIGERQHYIRLGVDVSVASAGTAATAAAAGARPRALRSQRRLIMSVILDLA